jgi:hypothetical protein
MANAVHPFANAVYVFNNAVLSFNSAVLPTLNAVCVFAIAENKRIPHIKKTSQPLT